jgi:hypothetical protein
MRAIRGFAFYVKILVIATGANTRFAPTKPVEKCGLTLDIPDPSV